MDYNTGHTARFLVSLFLNRKYSLKYKLNGNYRSILRYLADSMDFEFEKHGKRYTWLSRKQIAIYSGVSEATVKRAIAWLTKKRILKRYEYAGDWSSYWPGKLLIAYALKYGKLSTSRVTVIREWGHGDPTSNTLSSKLQTCNKGITITVKKINNEINSLENGLAAKEEMKRRLEKEGRI